MLPIVSKKSRKPLYEQLYDFYQKEILRRNIASGTRMPSVRQLARDLAVSNNTVVRAYEQLLHEGYIVNAPRKGLFVEKLEKIHVNDTVPAREAVNVKAPKVKFNLSHSQTDRRSFPMKIWRRLTQQALDTLHGDVYNYEDAAGLKQELVRYLYKSRGVRAAADQVIICAGTNVAASILAMMFRTSHPSLAFEEPGYDEVRSVFGKCGYNLKPVPVTRRGIDVEKLPNGKSQLAYVIPSHQYPTGAVLPVQERIRLLQWAKRTNSYIIEDDYDSEFRYKGRPIPSLQAIDQDDRVIYLGTFSKVLMPTLRVAYIVMPRNFNWRDSAINYMAWSVSYLTQKTLSMFLQQGYWERHLRKMRNNYRGKYMETATLIKKIFGDKVSFHHTDAGLYLVLQVKSKQPAVQLQEAAMRAGVRIGTTDECYLLKKKRPREFFFGFGDLTRDECETVLKLLKKVWGIE